jgi:two-component system, cell cycle response regulator
MPLKLLTVDDSRTIRLIITRTMAPYECTVIEATNGEEGLAAAASENPDIILLDITMPVMDGITMLAKLKENDKFKGVPVIMLSAESGREKVLQLAKLGIHDYISKPFRCDLLVEKIGHAVRLVKKPEAPAPIETKAAA